MKNGNFLCIILIFTAYLGAQIETELLFDFQLSSDEEIVDIQLFDYTNNGIEEICVSTSSDSSWVINIFEISGELINTLTFDYSTIAYPFNETHFFTFNNNNYVAILILHDYLYYYIQLDIYNQNMELVATNQEYIQEGDSEDIYDFSLTSDLEQQQLYLIYSYFYEFYEYGPGVNWGFTKSCGSPLIFDGNTLDEVENPPYLFYNYQQFSNIALSHYYSWSNPGSSSNCRGLFSISLNYEFIEIDTLETWTTWNSPTIIGSDDHSYDNYGIVYMYENTFTCLAPVTHEESWFSDFSHLGNNWDITTSANAKFNEDDKYLIYFEDYLCEIRDRTNGDIVHFEELININPYTLLRNQDGEIFVITQNNDLYQIHKITSINFQVSSNDYVINNPYEKIINYPNPFNPTTTIEFSIQNDSKIELTIFNIKGQKIKTLANNKFLKGSYSFIWNGNDESENPVSSGLYLYKLNVNGKTEAVNKCILLK